MPAIEGVARTTRRLADVALLAQAHTALGHELAARHEGEAALACYRHALDALEGSDVPALGVWAHRAIVRADQLGSDDVWGCAQRATGVGSAGGLRPFDGLVTIM